jgi:hypothetical protein
LEVEDRWGVGYKKAFANSHKPWLMNTKSTSFNDQFAGDEGLWEV